MTPHQALAVVVTAAPPPVPIVILEVVGSYNLNGGTFSANVIPGAVGHFNVTGTATLTNATLALTFLSGTYTAGQGYTVIRSAGLNGGFSTVIETGLPSTFTVKLTQTATDAGFTLVSAPVVVTIAAPNQSGLPPVLNSAFANASGTLLAVHDALLSLPPSQQQAALTQIGGITHTGAPMAVAGLRQSSNGLVMGRALASGTAAPSQIGLTGPIQLAFNGSTEALGRLLAAAGDASSAVAPIVNLNQGLWVQSAGNWDSSAGSGNAPGSFSRGGGIEGGYDRLINKEIRIGGAIGYGHADQSSEGTGAFGTIDSYRMSVYGGWEHGPYSLAVSLGYAIDQFESDRQINLGTLNLAVSSRHWGREYTASSEFDNTFRLGIFTLTPFASVDYALLDQSGFSENGADALDLAVASSHLDSLQPELGLKFSREFVTEDKMTIKPELRAGVRHEVLDATTNSTAQLVGASSAGFFSTQGATLDRTMIDFGTKVVANNGGLFDLYAAYDVRLSGHQSDQSLTAGARYAF